MDRYRIAEGVLCQELHHEAVLLHLGTEKYFSLDFVGTRIWNLLAQTHSVEDTARAMLSEFDVDEARLRGDIAALVGTLVAKGLLVKEPTGDA